MEKIKLESVQKLKSYMLDDDSRNRITAINMDQRLSRDKLYSLTRDESIKKKIANRTITRTEYTSALKDTYIDAISRFYTDSTRAKEIIEENLKRDEQGNSIGFKNIDDSILQFYKKNVDMFQKRIQSGTNHSLGILQNEIEGSISYSIPHPGSLPDCLDYIEARIK